MENSHEPRSVAESARERVSEVQIDAGAFTISHLSTSEHGLTVATTETLSRTAGIEGPFLTTDEAGRLRQSMQGEKKFQGGAKSHELREELREAIVAETGVEPHRALKLAREGKVSDELKERYAEFDAARQEYVSRMFGKIGIRDVELVDGVLKVKPKSVTFPAYNQFAKPTDSAEVLELSAATGVAMIVATEDGRLIVQHRGVARQGLEGGKVGRGNASYADIPGASVAGMLDAHTETTDRKVGHPDSLTTDSITRVTNQEAGEELGLEPEDLTDVRITGLAQDKVKIHDEFLLLANTNLTAAEVYEQSRTSKRNENLGDADFEEKFIDVPATPEAIYQLVAEVQAPLPPTHMASLTAAGYLMVLERQGHEAAEEWKERIAAGVRRNFEQIDRKVAAYYRHHPEALEQVPERYWGKGVPQRNPEAYTPEYTPTEQGLPSFEDELVRVGLVEEERRIVDEALLFDADGVLTNIDSHEVERPELLDQLATRLHAGEPVALNTGRSAEWAVETVIEPLREHLADPTDLENVIVVGEMGATWITFDRTGQPQFGKSDRLDLPRELFDEMEAMVKEKFDGLLWLDQDRHSMISTILEKGASREEFDARREELDRELVRIGEQYGILDDMKIGHTTIATDFDNIHVGKALGAERFMEFLRDRKIKPSTFTTFGDSPSDVEMARELARQGQDVDFVFVGEEAKQPEQTFGYNTVVISGYDYGTLRALKA